MDNFSTNRSLRMSLPEINTLNLSTTEQKSCTVGRNCMNSRAQLPLDKSNCRFLKQSVQSFLQQEGDTGSDELRRLDLSTDILESYCNDIKTSGATTKDNLDRVEKQITTISQNAHILWNRKRKEKGLSSIPSSPVARSCQEDSVEEDEVLLSLGAVLDRVSKLLASYCASLNSTNTDDQSQLQYSWNEPMLDSSRSYYLKTEDLFDTLQSREFQVKFSHAGLDKRLNRSKAKTISLQRHHHISSSGLLAHNRPQKSKRCIIIIVCVVIFILVAAIAATIVFLMYR